MSSIVIWPRPSEIVSDRTKSVSRGAARIRGRKVAATRARLASSWITCLTRAHCSSVHGTCELFCVIPALRVESNMEVRVTATNNELVDISNQRRRQTRGSPDEGSG